MEEEKYQKIRKLVADALADIITYEEFDRSVTEEDYYDFQRESNKRIREKVEKYH